MKPAITTVEHLWDTLIVSPSDDDLLIYNSGKWTNIALDDVLTDTLDDVAERGAATDQVLSVGGLNTASGDANDYLELVTESNKPIVRAIGGQTLYIDTDDPDFVRLRLGIGTHYAQIVIAKSTGLVSVQSSGNLMFSPGSGVIDCLLGNLVNVVAEMYPGLPDSFAANYSLYYSSDQNKLCFKDAGGVVRPLY